MLGKIDRVILHLCKETRRIYTDMDRQRSKVQCSLSSG